MTRDEQTIPTQLRLTAELDNTLRVYAHDIGVPLTRLVAMAVEWAEHLWPATETERRLCRLDVALPERLHERLRAAAEEQGASINSLVAGALQRYLAPEETQ